MAVGDPSFSSVNLNYDDIGRRCETNALRSDEIESVEIHDLVPGRHKVVHEFLL
jgi:hypothetical protein